MMDAWALPPARPAKVKKPALPARDGPLAGAPPVATGPGLYKDSHGLAELLVARKPVLKSLPSIRKAERQPSVSDPALVAPIAAATGARRGREAERTTDAARSPSVSPTGSRSMAADSPVPYKTDDTTSTLRKSLIDSEKRAYEKASQDYASVRGSGKSGKGSLGDAASTPPPVSSTLASGVSAAAHLLVRSSSPPPSSSLTSEKLPPIGAHRLPVLLSESDKRPSARTPPGKSLPADILPPPLSMRQRVAAAAPPTSLSELEDDDVGYYTAPDDVARAELPQSSRGAKGNRIRVVVRKRPINASEGGVDCVIVETPVVHVEATKQRVDLTEYVESHHYVFDHSFDCDKTNEEVYEDSAKALLDVVFEGGSASCFAYGQTGSGKTYTMMGVESEPGLYILAARDIFSRVSPTHRVFVSLYEIYCNSLFDLLNHRAVVVTREDANKRVNVCGLTWHEVTSVKELMKVMERGAVQRRTGSTSANEFSSRSHAVMTITLRDEAQPKFLGMLNVVDLAGSERAADTAATDKQTRLEGAEINKSLLALKECIRGLDERKKHIPFRGSKLTEVLRDSFVGNSQTVMIATISPSTTNAEHSLNTLRYAFRVKGLSIDCPAPCAERNAPRPTQRAKSSNPVPSARDKKKKKKEKDRVKEGRRRRVGESGITDEALAVFETQMKAEIAKLQTEMETLRAAKSRDEETIIDLHRQNEELMAKMNAMRRMYTYHDVTAGGSDDGDDEVGSARESTAVVASADGTGDSTEERRKHRRKPRRRTSVTVEDPPVSIEELGA